MIADGDAVELCLVDAQRRHVQPRLRHTRTNVKLAAQQRSRAAVGWCPLPSQASRTVPSSRRLRAVRPRQEQGALHADGCPSLPQTRTRTVRRSRDESGCKWPGDKHRLIGLDPACLITELSICSIDFNLVAGLIPAAVVPTIQDKPGPGFTNAERVAVMLEANVCNGDAESSSPGVDT